LAAELKEHLGIEATLVPGSGGVFDVTVDGNSIFSKKAAGRFPRDGEILEKLKKTR